MNMVRNFHMQNVSGPEAHPNTGCQINRLPFGRRQNRR